MPYTHSGAEAIWMRLHYDADRVTLSIIDNGRGFDATRGVEGTDDRPLGLTTMKERAQQAGGPN